MPDGPDKADPMASFKAQMEEFEAQMAEFERKSADVTQLVESVGLTREQFRERAQKNGVQRIGALFRRAEAGDFFTEPKAAAKPRRVKVRL